MQKNSKQFEYIGNYKHSLGGDDFALRPCTKQIFKALFPLKSYHFQSLVAHEFRLF